MPTPGDCISSAEFTRWMNEQSEFRSRLEQRLIAQHKDLVDSLVRIEDQVRLTNGQTRKNGEEIIDLKGRLARIEKEDDEIERVVQSIKNDGCSQYAAHVHLLGGDGTAILERRFTFDSLTRNQKIAAGTGLGLVLTPALVELVKAALAFIQWLHEHGVL